MTDDNEHMSHFTFSSHSNQSEFSFGNSINLIISGFEKHCHTEYRERERETEIIILKNSLQALIFFHNTQPLFFLSIVSCVLLPVLLVQIFLLLYLK